MYCKHEHLSPVVPMLTGETSFMSAGQDFRSWQLESSYDNTTRWSPVTCQNLALESALPTRVHNLASLRIQPIRTSLKFRIRLDMH
jgi:hypothetical protein